MSVTRDPQKQGSLPTNERLPKPEGKLGIAAESKASLRPLSVTIITRNAHKTAGATFQGLPRAARCSRLDPA